jgi:hypothetical protein
VFWLGPPGVGKSFMVQAIGYQAIKAGYTEACVAHWKTRGNRSSTKFIWLSLLEMWIVSRRKSLNCLWLQICYSRNNVEPSLEDWGKQLGDAPSATAILDRCLHHAELVQMTGRSYRLQHRTTALPEGVEDSNPANAPSGSAAKRPSSKLANAPSGSGVA